jgi:hypothetical protein
MTDYAPNRSLRSRGATNETMNDHELARALAAEDSDSEQPRKRKYTVDEPIDEIDFDDDFDDDSKQ